MRSLLVIASATAAAAVVAAGALAVTNGVPDGDGHPSVGELLAQQAFSDGTWSQCTGALIAPKVFLTAEHCDEGVSRVSVTFESTYVPGKSKTYSGTWVGDPDYNQSFGDAHDLAVVLLDRAPIGITPASLPTLGEFDWLGNGAVLTSVGYGAQSVTSDKGGHTLHFQDVRYVTTGTVSSLTQYWVHASMNPIQGDGGGCNGDSGSPKFPWIGGVEVNVVVGIDISGDTYCRSTDVSYRIDTPSARAFLGRFVTLP